jgi:site-specific DNA recombinase
MTKQTEKKSSIYLREFGFDVDKIKDDSVRKFIGQILEAILQFEKSAIVSKLRAGRQRVKQLAGRCEGRKPYGYYPGEDTVIKRIRVLYRKKPGENRLSCHKIAKILNKENQPTRKGGLWQGPQVKQILERLKLAK